MAPCRRPLLQSADAFVEACAFGSRRSAQKNVYFPALRANRSDGVKVFGPGCLPGYPPWRARDIPPKSFMFRVLFRSWTLPFPQTLVLITCPAVAFSEVLLFSSIPCCQFLQPRDFCIQLRDSSQQLQTAIRVPPQVSFTPPSIRNLSMVFRQILVDVQSTSIDFLSSISFGQFQSVLINFNQFNSVKNAGIYWQPEGGENNT